ncbi:uncharacterized protein SPAPADRAFT_55724 [Spathaspora passalidarum NRRL Y-27907]|uniref:Uncharacterized protein n=1 Tax=Spathaspora passalidarum (strain NRRL Y-27907 / 11-Y1) TaxID=619300 RepID=G3APP7_SPAPN|nr:uncharacterized protein SPAPADRAFT_55724 [Spathaspora passalidarum NRRL Y-27907]EGW32219.1 hypothetical protein SPAPADRAFT_55724 [Spathaspora passalidarum NRRL Y-27907]
MTTLENISHIQPSTSAGHQPQPEQDQSPAITHRLAKTTSNNKRVYYSTGRGGAGNMQHSSQIPSPKLIPMGSNTPQLTTSKITTGRGGYGNMISNSDPQLARKLQDVDSPPPGDNELKAIASNNTFSVGRGGFGNVISHQKSSSSSGSGDVPNLYAVTSHNKEQRKKGGLLGKIKEIFG